MAKKRVLIFIDWFLPGTKAGGPVRSCANLIDYLGDEIEFSIITRDKDYCETESYPAIETNSWNKFGANARIFYISDKNLNYRFLKELIDATDFDSAYINGIYSRFFSILPVFILRNSWKPVIVAARGMLNPQAFSVKPKKKKAFLSVLNLVSFYKNVQFHATNEDEAAFISRTIKNYKNIKVAPNLPRQMGGKITSVKDRQETLKFVSVARVAREKGTLTTLKALLSLNLEQKIQFDIYGPIYDEEYWKRCEEVIKKLANNIKVNYRGSIAGDKVPEFLKNYHFFIMPSEGENFGHGILEALTAGCPVIISDKTPWTNLKDKEIGWDCSLNSDELNSALVEATAMDQKTYNRWSANAFKFAKEYCNDPKALKASRELFL